MILLHLVMMSFAAMANQDHVYYSSYCAAILERQADRQSFDREEINAALNAVATRSQSYFESKFNDRNDDERARLEADQPSVDYVHFDQRDAGQPELSLSALVDVHFLNAIPRRIAQIHRDLNSITDGVVARAVVIAGRPRIQTYFDEVDRALRRNNRTIDDNFERIFPYVSPRRVIGNSIFLGVPTVVNGALAACLGPAILELEVGAAEIGTIALALPISFMYRQSIGYFKGFVSAEARQKYESHHGVRSHHSRGTKVNALRDVLQHPREHTDAIVYLADEFVLTEAEMLELKAAAAASRAPNDDFVRAQERPLALQSTEHSDEPTVYRLRIDQMMYFDHARRDFVLVVIDRFVREQIFPGRPKTPKWSERNARDWGGLRPGGI